MRAKWFDTFRPVVAASLLAILTASCAKEEVDQDLEDVIALEADCREKLAAGQYSEARNKAEVVINTSRLASVDDIAVDKARFCYTTANSLYQLNELTKNLQTLLGTVFGLFGGSVGVAPAKMTPQDFQQLALDYREGRLEPKVQSAIGILLGSFTKPIQNTLEENQAQLEEIIKKKRFSWSIQHLPVKIADTELMDAGGSYDLGEIYLLYGLTRSILSTFYLIQGQDYTIAAKPLADYVLGDVQDNPILEISEHPGRAVTNLLAVLMGTSPTFLTLDKSVGAELMKKAGEGFSKGFGSILDAVKFMKEKRRGDQTTHVVEFKTEDDLDFFIIHIKFNNGANPIPIVDLQKFDGVTIPLQENVLESLQHLRDDFADVPGVDTNLQRDIFPIVALVVVVIIQSGAFDALIDLALSSSDAETKGTADQVLGIIGNNQDIIVGALVALVPVEIQFDFGHIFKAPGGLRDIFPAWTQPEFASEFTKMTRATIVYSYECAAGEPADPLMEDTFICKNATQDSDKAHFLELLAEPEPYEMWDIDLNGGDGAYFTDEYSLLWKNYASANNFGPKWQAQAPTIPDGIPSSIPYIGFKDPTFGGLLYLNIEAIQSEQLKQKNGFQPATLTTLNATLANIVSTITGFLK